MQSIGALNGIHYSPANKKLPFQGSVLKSIAKGSAITAGVFSAVTSADLVLTKGNALNTLSGGKISYIKTMNEDIETVLEKDPAAKGRIEVMLCYPGVHALWTHRIAHKLYEWKIPVIPRLISNISRIFTNIEIHPGAKIGHKVFIDHTGLLVGETAEIGDGCELIENVVLGGVSKEKKKRHPTLEENVQVGCGARIIGNFTVGKNSKIGANSVVLKEVPPNSTMVGIPAKAVSRNED